MDPTLLSVRADEGSDSPQLPTLLSTLDVIPPSGHSSATDDSDSSSDEAPLSPGHHGSTLASDDALVLSSQSVIDSLFHEAFDIVAPVAAVQQLFKNRFAPGPLSFVIHKIGNTLVIDGGVDDALACDLSKHSHTALLLSCLRANPSPATLLTHTIPTTTTNTTTATPTVPDGVVDEPPLLLLTNQPANYPYPLSLLHRNQALADDIVLESRLSTATLPSQCQDEDDVKDGAERECEGQSNVTHDTDTSHTPGCHQLALYHRPDHTVEVIVDGVRLGTCDAVIDVPQPSTSHRTSPLLTSSHSPTPTHLSYQVPSPMLLPKPYSTLRHVDLWLQQACTPTQPVTDTTTPTSSTSTPTNTIPSSSGTTSDNSTSHSALMLRSTPIIADLLAMLKTHCTDENTTYWVCTDPRDGTIRLFSFVQAVAEWPSSQPTNTILSSFSKPVALLCLRAAEKLYRNRCPINPPRNSNTRVVDPDTAALLQFDPRLCKHLYTRCVQLLPPSEDALLWSMCQGRLGSLQLPCHMWPSSTPPTSHTHTHTHVTKSDVTWSVEGGVRHWLSVPCPSPSTVSGMSLPLLDEDTLQRDAVFSAIPRIMCALCVLHDTFGPVVCADSIGAGGKDRWKLELQLRSILCHTILVAAKFAVLQGRCGHALRLCCVVDTIVGGVAGLNSSNTNRQHPNATHFLRDVMSECAVIAGCCYLFTVNRIRAAGATLDISSVLMELREQFHAPAGLLTASLPTDEPSPSYDDREWLIDVNLLSISTCVPPPTMSVFQRYCVSLGLSQPPPTITPSQPPVTGSSVSSSVSGVALMSPDQFQEGEIVSMDNLLHLTTQLYLRCWQYRAPATGHPSSTPLLWQCGVQELLSNAYDHTGAVLVDAGRYTKAIQHHKQGETVFQSLGMPEVAAIQRFSALKLMWKAKPPPSASDVEAVAHDAEALGELLLTCTKDADGLIACLTALPKHGSATDGSLVSYSSGYTCDVECQRMVCDVHVLLYHVHHAVLSRCWDMLLVVKSGSDITPQLLTLLSSWFSVAVIGRSGLKAGDVTRESQRKVSTKALTSIDFWSNAVNDAEEACGYHLRAALQLCASPAVPQAIHCLTLLATLAHASLVRSLLIFDGSLAANFTAKCDLAHDQWSKAIAAAVTAGDLPAAVSALASECRLWVDMHSLLCDRIGAGLVKNPGVDRAAIDCCLRVLDTVTGNVAVLRDAAVSVFDTQHWTIVASGLLSSLKYLSKHMTDAKFKAQYRIALTNPHSRSFAWELVDDVAKLNA